MTARCFKTASLLIYDLSLRWFLIYKAIKPALLLLLLHHQLFLDLFDISSPYQFSNPLCPLFDHALSLLLDHPSLFDDLLLLLLQHLIMPGRQLFEVVARLEPLTHTAVLVQVEVVERPLENQRVHVVRRLLQALVERRQVVLGCQLVLERRLT